LPVLRDPLLALNPGREVRDPGLGDMPALFVFDRGEFFLAFSLFPSIPDRAWALGCGAGLAPHALALLHRLLENVLDLSIDTPQFIPGPGLEVRPEFGVDAQKKGFA